MISIHSSQVKMPENFFQVISNMVDLHDPYAAGHQVQVALLARAIAQEMSSDDRLANCVFIAGQIHDIGKIVIPPETLSSPGKLNYIQHAAIMTHPRIGYAMVQPINFPYHVADVVYQHHERLNGSGYPLGLSGDQIIMESRILTVADVVESMMSNRSYHTALGIEKVFQELEDNCGALYDAEVVNAYKFLVEGNSRQSSQISKNSLN